MKKLAIVFVVLTTGCSGLYSRECTELVCLPRGSEVIGKNSTRDSVAYLVRFEGENVGVLETRSSDTGFGKSSVLAIPIDKDAKLIVAEGQGQILAQIGGDDLHYVQFIGPCRSGDNCLVLRFAKGTVLGG